MTNTELERTTDLTVNAKQQLSLWRLAAAKPTGDCYFAAHGYILLGAQTSRPHTSRKRVALP